MKNNTQRYSKEFYDVAAIKSAIAAYRKIATVSFSEDSSYYVCEFSNCIIDPNRVIFEFNNYLVELMNARGDNTEA